MADIKLTYFNFKGRAEFSRFILACAGAKYVDERITGEEFMAQKSSLRYGQVPMLTYNGVQIFQSIAMARLLANEFNLAGRNNEENAQADEVVDTVTDIIDGLLKARNSPDSEKIDAMKKFLTVTLPHILEKLEQLLVARGGQYFVGNHLTWADLCFYNIYDYIREKDLLNSFSCLKNLVKRVEEMPNIKNHLSTRPESLK